VELDAIAQEKTPPPTATPLVPTAGAPSGDAYAGLPVPVDTPTPAPAASTDAAATQIAPAVQIGPAPAVVAWSTPATPEVTETAASAEPLPAYGSDLRPPAEPPALSREGAAVAPVERVLPGANSPALPSGAALPATVRAAAGLVDATAAASTKAAQQRRLRRIVAAVARQEPGLAWAAGLRDDGVTTLLTTDLAAGWIPPHIRLPAHVAVLDPGVRRRDCTAVELLGAVVVAATHQPHADVAESGIDAPALTGDRQARSAVPIADELGPALVDAVRRRAGLPTIARTLAAPAARRTGVLGSEAELLRTHIAEVRRAVLTTYPEHDPAAVGDWMLLASVAALIEDRPYLANYHLAWFEIAKSEYR